MNIRKNEEFLFEFKDRDTHLLSVKRTLLNKRIVIKGLALSSLSSYKTVNNTKTLAMVNILVRIIHKSI